MAASISSYGNSALFLPLHRLSVSKPSRTMDFGSLSTLRGSSILGGERAGAVAGFSFPSWRPIRASKSRRRLRFPLASCSDAPRSFVVCFFSLPRFVCDELLSILFGCSPSAFAYRVCDVFKYREVS